MYDSLPYTVITMPLMQRAEEMIKREMMIMLHYDCVESPTPAQQGQGGEFLSLPVLYE
jgi:hypothetical protein